VGCGRWPGVGKGWRDVGRDLWFIRAAYSGTFVCSVNQFSSQNAGFISGVRYVRCFIKSVLFSKCDDIGEDEVLVFDFDVEGGAVRVCVFIK
jgi:hypothetical protein